VGAGNITGKKNVPDSSAKKAPQKAGKQANKKRVKPPLKKKVKLCRIISTVPCMGITYHAVGVFPSTISALS
jgi:hypothetical protein